MTQIQKMEIFPCSYGGAGGSHKKTTSRWFLHTEKGKHPPVQSDFSTDARPAQYGGDE
jgi:hypothetical protein